MPRATRPGRAVERGREKPKAAWRSAKRVGLYLGPEWWAFLSKESARRKGAHRIDADYSSIVADGLRLLSSQRRGRHGTSSRETPRAAWRTAKRAGLYMAMEWWSFLVEESARRKQALRADNDYSSIVTDGLRLLRKPRS